MMVLPILSYGHNILRQKCPEMELDFADRDKLIENMWETLYGANGCGLAAPQVNVPFRLFIVDSKSTFANSDLNERKMFAAGDEGIVETFINAQIIERSEEKWIDVEGCLSIPSLAEEVSRPFTITIEYYNRNLQKQKRSFGGVTARMIQHEYDHTEGILYLDHLTPLKRKLLAGRLKKVAEGKVNVKYPMKFIK